MTPDVIFNLQLGLGYVPWLLICGAYVWPKLAKMDRVDAHRVIAALHSFRFFGLVFLVPGVVGPNLPASFAEFAAYGDFATGVLAMLALMAVHVRPLFLLFVVAFNTVGAVDIIVDYIHGVELGLAVFAGQLGSAYGIVIVYVPLLLITHATVMIMLLRPQRHASTENRQARV